MHPLAFSLLCCSCFHRFTVAAATQNPGNFWKLLVKSLLPHSHKAGDWRGSMEANIQPVHLPPQRRKEWFPPPFYPLDFTQVHFIGRALLSRESVKCGSWASNTCREGVAIGVKSQPVLFSILHITSMMRRPHLYSQGS